MTTRRLIALAAVAGLVLALTAPVAAKGKPDKPPRPEDPPELVEVTMTGDLATSCDDGDGFDGVMLMEGGAGDLAPANLAVLALDIPAVDTSRLYPEPVIAEGFSGCHGELLDGTASRFGGLFISLDDAGAVTDLLWHFDYYVETMTRGRREVLSLMEHFTLSGHEPLAWDAGTSTVSGWFTLAYHLEDFENHTAVRYVPVDGSPVFLEFTVTMAPHG